MIASNVVPILSLVGKKQGKPLQTFRTYERRQREQGLKLVPEGHAVFTYAANAGIPHEFLYLAWYRFKDYHTQDNPDKKYKDWPIVFLKAVKGNWFKLWYLDGNEYKLTTVGMQTERAMKNG